jgi:hypothetical protein
MLQISETSYTSVKLLLVMVEERPTLGLPLLKENPFQARPLESGQSPFLVGRDAISARWAGFLHQRAARFSLLIGERGSGRTSLLRCLSEEVDQVVHIDMYPEADPTRCILDEMYAALVGFDIPSSRQQIVHRLVESTSHNEGPMPLIALDFSSADGKGLSEVISRLISALERMQALVVVTLTTDQRLEWPEGLVERFDHVEKISTLSVDEIATLAQKRIESVSREPWEMNSEAIDYVMDKTNGQVGRVIRILRDMVDEERSRPRKLPQEPVIEPEFVPANVPSIEDEPDNISEKIPAFELDMELMAEDPMSIPPPVLAPPAVGASPFSGLIGRNRNNLSKRITQNKTPDPSKGDARRSDSEDGTQLWMAKGADLIEQTIHEDILDQQFTPEEDTTEDEQFIAPPERYEEGPSEHQYSDDGGLLQEMLHLMSRASKARLSEMLSALRQPVIGERVSFPLDVNTLRNLSKVESIVVEVASERSFSPSDSRLQDRLGIKRPRMSQICNHLQRAGLLEVRQEGRSRKFSLTNDARAQLIAWGMLEVRQ